MDTNKHELAPASGPFMNRGSRRHNALISFQKKKRSEPGEIGCRYFDGAPATQEFCPRVSKGFVSIRVHSWFNPDN